MLNNWEEIYQTYFGYDKLKHAYILTGHDVESILNHAIKISLNLNNLELTDENVEKVKNNQNQDIRLIESPGNTIKKSQIKELEEEFSYTSLIDNNKRIYIINEAHKLNRPAANTLLKFLEEPSSNIIAILIAKNRNFLPDTILSRCEIIYVFEQKENKLKNETLEFLDMLDKYQHRLVFEGEKAYLRYLYEGKNFEEILKDLYYHYYYMLLKEITSDNLNLNLEEIEELKALMVKMDKINRVMSKSVDNINGKYLVSLFLYVFYWEENDEVLKHSFIEQ